MKLAAFILLAASALRGDQCRELQRHGKLTEAAACYGNLTRSADAFQRAEGFLGLQRYDEANAEFRNAEEAHPNSAEVKAEWARMFNEHAQPDDAAKLYREAISLDPNYAPAYLGLARVLSGDYEKKAVELAQEALQHDPKFADAHEFLAYLALEDDKADDATNEAKKALTLNGEALDAMSVLASIDWLKGAQASPWLTRILVINPRYGEAYATGAHFFVINYRYDEAIQFYRKALDLDPALWAARSQLGVNLMRLGFTAEARTELERCYAAHYRDAETVNSLRLLDTEKDYETINAGLAHLVINKKEVALLAPYVEPELRRAIATYSHLYHVSLATPVRLELYPNHDDFAVRTLGLPGQGGLLGVTFDTVVAMDSPSARPAGDFNWADTMWHELNHVFVINATNRLAPRWFAEGVAVHEEGVISPGWGNRLTPDIVTALKEKKLLPVLELDRGFVRPEYANQVLVSYYEAGKIFDYIASKWGDGPILGMIHSYGARKSTAEAIEDNLHESPQLFDKEFVTWLDEQTRGTVQHFDEWQRGMKAAGQALRDGNAAEALKQASSVRDYYPDYIESSYQIVADAYLSGGDKQHAMQELERYRNRGGSAVTILKRLAQLESETNHPAQAITTLQKLNFIYPEDQSIHQELGSLLLKAGNSDAAVREYRAALALNPADVAQSHFDLARALQAAHRDSDAKSEVLVALEAAPDFKPAQQLLLQLSQ